MHPVFETGTAATATPITFVTKSSLSSVVETLDAPARQFIEAAAFKAKPGQCLLLPRAERRHRAGAVRHRRRFGKMARSVPAGPASGAAAAGRLSLRQRAARCAPGRARLRARQLPLHALPQGGCDGGEAAAAERARRRGRRAGWRRRHAGARPHQHSGQRHGPGGARSGRAYARRASRRHVLVRSSATTCSQQNFPLIHAVGARADPRAAADRHQLGRSFASQGDARRQGRVLRHRRPRHQARRAPC